MNSTYVTFNSFVAWRKKRKSIPFILIFWRLSSLGGYSNGKCQHKTRTTNSNFKAEPWVCVNGSTIDIYLCITYSLSRIHSYFSMFSLLLILPCLCVHIAKTESQKKIYTLIHFVLMNFFSWNADGKSIEGSCVRCVHFTYAHPQQRSIENPIEFSLNFSRKIAQIHFCIRSVRSLAYAHSREQFLSDHHRSSTTYIQFPFRNSTFNWNKTGKYPLHNTVFGLFSVSFTIWNTVLYLLLTLRGVSIELLWKWYFCVLKCCYVSVCVCVSRLRHRRIVLFKFHQCGKFLLHTLNNCGSANV